MTGFYITDFAGMAPRVSPRLLVNNQAQEAVNAKLWSGELSAFRDLAVYATPTKAGVKKTIYRFGQNVPDAHYLDLPGSSGNYASTPDTAANSVTGDLEVVVRIAAADWTPATQQTIVSKWLATGNQRSWQLRLDTTGTLSFLWSADGASSVTVTSTANLASLANGKVKWVRVTVDVDNGTGGHDVAFYTSDDGSSWVQLGSTVTTAGNATRFDSSAVLALGAVDDGGGNFFVGRIYQAKVYSGIGGTLVSDFDPLRAEVGALSFTAVTGETWSVNQSGSPKAEIKGESRYWFHWLTDVDVVRGPINNDTSERTYWTGESEPRVTDNSIALTGGTDYPMNWYKLGIPKPADTPSISSAGGGTGDPKRIAVVYTYVSAWGEEGPPSDPSGILSIKDTDTLTVSGMSTGPGAGYNIATKRIYVAISGSTSTDFQFWKEVPVAATSHSATLDFLQLAEVIRSKNWTPPPVGLKGLIAMGNGMMAGFQNNDVWLCEPFLPHAWPARYRKSVPFEIVGLGTFDTYLVVLTRGVPYAGSATTPASLVLSKVADGKACVAKRGIVNFAGAVIYPCAEGLGMVSAGGWRLITEAFFTRDEWQLLKPESISAYRLGNRYVGFYDTGTVQRGFIFDPFDARASFIYIDVYATAGYNDPQTDLLYLQIGDEIRRWDSAGTRNYTWKSKLFSLPRPISPSCAQVIARSYPVTFKLYADGALLHQQSVQNAEPFRLPSGGRYRDFEVQLEGSASVRGVAVAEAVRELKEIVT